MLALWMVLKGFWQLLFGLGDLDFGDHLNWLKTPTRALPSCETIKKKKTAKASKVA